MLCSQFLITTFEREEGLDNLLKSIKKYYPDADIIIGKQGDNLPYNCGLSFARNRLVERANSEFVLILEDDFIFTDKTNIEVLQEILKRDNRIGIIGGRVKEQGFDFSFEHDLEKIGNELWHTKKEKREKDKIRFEGADVNYSFYDCIPNFFLARREALLKNKWDDRLKLAEHTDFFLRFNGWKVAFTDQVEIETKKINNQTYRGFKSENHAKCIKTMIRKHKLKKIIYLNGSTLELEGDTIKKYRVNYEHYKRQNRKIV